MKAMTIGISPDYNYPGSFEKWAKDNTYYASNHGGSLITRAIMREFNADYIDDFSNMAELKNKYDTCILSLATHAHATRDISRYVDILEKLQVKVIVISLGVEDYLSNPNVVYKLHPSVIRLLKLASEGNNWIGVRGPYTASILQQNNIKNVVPVGCPTVYWNMERNFKLNLKDSYEKPLIVYHKTIMKEALHLVENKKLMGQDFQDQAIFTDTLLNDTLLNRGENIFYNSLSNKKEVLSKIKKHGYFPFTFDEWFDELPKSDIVFGPRLHGVIGSLIQGVPAILATRDLRTREMAEVFNLPSVDYSMMKKYNFDDLVKSTDFEKFQETYKYRYDNYVAFIEENKIASNFDKINVKYQYQTSDIQTSLYLQNVQTSSLKESSIKHKVNSINEKIKYFKNGVVNRLKLYDK